MPLELNDKNKTNNIFDDVEIIVDPELEDESTVDINDYLNKYILQCRICGNMFPSTEILDNDIECPICDSKSSNGFIYKGKLLKKKDKEISSEKEDAINELNNDENEIFNQEHFNSDKKDDLYNNIINNNI